MSVVLICVLYFRMKWPPSLHIWTSSTQILNVVKVTKVHEIFQTNTHKPTHTGLYTNLYSFTEWKYKINLVKCLFSRAWKIYSNKELFPKYWYNNNNCKINAMFLIILLCLFLQLHIGDCTGTCTNHPCKEVVRRNEVCKYNISN